MPVLVTTQWPAAPGCNSAHTGLPPKGPGCTVKLVDACMGPPSALVAVTFSMWGTPLPSGLRAMTNTALREASIERPRDCSVAEALT